MLSSLGSSHAAMSNSTPTSISLPLITTSPTSIPQLPDVDVDNDNCRLLGPFALVVQALMGILVVGSLVWKRQHEKPRRPWKTWLLDITKQMLGQLFVHTLNVVLSNFAAHIGEQNPCSLYFLNILIDTTLGVFIIYLTLRLTTHILTDIWGFRGFVSGQYSDRPKRRQSRKTPKPKLEFWLKQLGMYFFALLIMKVVVTILFVLFPFLFAFGAWLLGLFGEAKNAQVLFVMCLFPLAMNTLQFWLVDSFLRHNPNKSKYAQVGEGDLGQQQQGGGGGGGTPGSSGLPAWGLREQNSANATEYQEHTGLVLGDEEDDEEDDDEEDEEEGSSTGRTSPSLAQPNRQRKFDFLSNAQESSSIIRSRTSSPASQHSYPPPGEAASGSVGITIPEGETEQQPHQRPSSRASGRR